MHILDDQKLQRRIDPEDMYHMIINLPEQVLKSYTDSNLHIPGHITGVNKGDVKRIVLCGMGGSAIAGDIARAAFGRKLPISVVKDYEIPWLDQETLVVVTSYSGNTAETLSCFMQAVKNTGLIAAITSGGKLRELVEDRFVWAKIPAGDPPRTAIAALFFSLMKILEHFRIIDEHNKAVKALTANLIQKAGAIAVNNPLERNLAKATALEISGRIPVLYAEDPQLEAIIYRWKCQINENAKYPAYCLTFPEMNHNEIECWEDGKTKEKIIPLFIRRFKQKESYRNRMEAVKGIYKKYGIPFLEFYTEGDKLIEEIFSLIYLGDMVSYYLAILNKVNPTKINFITELKEAIK